MEDEGASSLTNIPHNVEPKNVRGEGNGGGRRRKEGGERRQERGERREERGGRREERGGRREERGERGSSNIFYRNKHMKLTDHERICMRHTI